MITTVKAVAPPTRRGVELALLVFAAAIVIGAYVNVDVALQGQVPQNLATLAGGFIALVLIVHLVVRWKAPYADPVLLPIATLLNGLGLVMIHRLDLANKETDAFRQLVWTGLGVLLAIIVLLVLTDHRVLRRYTFTAMFIGLVLLLMPLLPVLGRAELGSRIWIRLGPLSFQPGEFAKLALAVYFAGYLVNTRDVLSLAGRHILGFPFPRARDLGPILIAWLLSLAVLVFEKDLGSALLFFGLFVAMLYVATERVSWVVIGLSLFAGGAYVAWRLFPHVQTRVDLWLNTFSEPGNQLAKGLMGMGAGGLFGTGLGEGRPWITPLPASDYIFPSLAEELGLFGAAAILVLYLLFAERGIRTAIGVRDNFGKLLAVGLSFTLALQCFIVLGGVLRIIPLTGLTTPFMSLGGSALLANWALLAVLMRISDQARRPVPEARPLPPPGAPADEIGQSAADSPTEVVNALP